MYQVAANRELALTSHPANRSNRFHPLPHLTTDFPRGQIAPPGAPADCRVIPPSRTVFEEARILGASTGLPNVAAPRQVIAPDLRVIGPDGGATRSRNPCHQPNLGRAS